MNHDVAVITGTGGMGRALASASSFLTGTDLLVEGGVTAAVRAMGR